MWFLIGALAILVLIMIRALVSDLRRRAQLRRLGDETPRAGVDAAARRGRAGVDVGNGPVSGRSSYGYSDIDPTG